MSLWVDKYRPSELEKLDYHDGLTGRLKRLAASDDFPHLLVYGPSGAGKKTRIHAVLRELFGAKVDKVKVEQRIFTTPSNRKIEINVAASNVHLEMNPADVGIYDRVVIQDLIKSVAQTQQVDAAASRRFKVVVIREADRLSRDAQHGLRRTMEKYMANLRIILCCNSTSRIISPIQSRCLLVRVPAPSHEQTSAVLLKTAAAEGFKVPSGLLDRIVAAADGNLRVALLQLETTRVENYPLSDDQQVPLADWIVYIRETAAEILAEQTPGSLLKVRARLYELLTHCIPAEIIIKHLAFELTKSLEDSLKIKTVCQAAFYEHRLRTGSKAIVHLEAFVAKFMHLYKQYLLELIAT